jgi:hypothetical protein
MRAVVEVCMHVCRFRVSVISVLIKVTENYFMQHDVPPLHCKQDPSEEQWGGVLVCLVTQISQWIPYIRPLQIAGRRDPVRQ